MITVRPIETDDRPVWEELYAGYCEFYKSPFTPEKAELVWSWLMNPEHQTSGLVAVDDDDTPIAIAHWREFARPLAGSLGIYLDDLFTHPDLRGTGAGTALIQRLQQIAKERGASVVRWITANDNFVAQQIYERLAQRTMWVTYDLAVN